jgi:hypothetical protein
LTAKPWSGPPLAKKSAGSKDEKGGDKFMKSTTTGKRRPQATNNHQVDCTLQRATSKTTKQQEELSGKPNRSPGNPQSAGEVHAALTSKAYFWAASSNEQEIKATLGNGQK